MAKYTESKRATRRSIVNNLELSIHRVTCDDGSDPFWLIYVKDIESGKLLLNDSITYDDHDKYFWTTAVYGNFNTITALFEQLQISCADGSLNFHE